MNDKKKDKDLQLLNSAFDKMEEYIPIWLEWERYYEAEHTDKQFKKLEKLGRSKLFIPITRNIVNIIRSIFTTSFFNQGCPIELETCNDKTDDEVAKLNKVIDYYYRKLKPNKELSKAFLSAISFGMGIVTTYWDDRKQKVVTTCTPITNIAFDFEATNIDNVEFIGYKFYESRRTIKNKIKDGFYGKKAGKELFGYDKQSYKRYEVKEIYTITDKGWRCKTFIKDILVRSVHFEQLPFQYGYAIDKLASIDEEKRKDQILAYGQSIIEYIKVLNDEVNIKRNQKNDLIEEMINPSIIIPDTTQIKANDLKKGAGKRIRAEGGTDGLLFMPTNGDVSISHDLGILDKDISDASSVNSIQQGQTGASDRRSANALAVVNANSSMRTEDMIMLCKETLFEHWAKAWVKLILKNASDEVINRITGDAFPFGELGKREDFEFDMKINFGMTIDKEKRINDLVSLLQIIGQNPNMNPVVIERVFKEILNIRMGDSMNIDKLFSDMEQNVTDEQNDNETVDEVTPLVTGSI